MSAECTVTSILGDGSWGGSRGGEMQDGGGTLVDDKAAIAVIAAVRAALGSSSEVYMQLL